MSIKGLREKQLVIRCEDDIYTAISLANQLLKGLPFSVSDRQKIFVSISELTRNVLDHAGGSGVFTCRVMDGRIEIEVVDKGPGISDCEDVLSGTRKNPLSSGLGLGIISVKKIMDDFSIETKEGTGTRVIVAKKGG